MSHINSFSSSATPCPEQQQSAIQSVTSLRKDYLQNLRFPNQNKSSNVIQKPRIHLLACMSQFIENEPQNKLQQIEDFCCFDRIKKVIQKSDHDSMCRKGKGDQQAQAKQKTNLMKLIQVQNKIRKMEQTLTKYSGQQNKNQNQNGKSGNKENKSSVYDPTPANLFLTATVQEKWKDGVITQNQLKKQNKSQNFFGKHEMRKKLREQGFKQYLQWQKKKIVNSENDIRQFVETSIEQKVKNMLQQRDIKFNQLLKQNKNLQRSILQKNLQIQNLKSKQSILSNNMKVLQNFKNQYLEQNALKIKEKQNFEQNFYQQFCQTFPGYTITSLKSYIQTLTDKCLNKFNEIQTKNVAKWRQQKMQMCEKIQKLESIICKFKTNQNQLLSNLKQYRYEQNSAHVQIDLLIQKQTDLQKLQKKILSLYNDWYGKVPQSSKQIMKNIGYLQTNYGYEQMLEHIVVFENKLSTDSKVNDYLIKILRGIQRIRKILFPRTISNSDDRKQILDPLYILQKLQKYIKSKVYQMQKKANCIQKGSRTSHIIQQQFLGIQDDKIVQETNNEIIRNENYKNSFSSHYMSTRNKKKF